MYAKPSARKPSPPFLQHDKRIMNKAAKALKQLLAETEYEGWVDDILTEIEDPEVAQWLPSVLEETGRSVRNRLIELDEATILIALLGLEKGKPLTNVVTRLLRLDDPEGTIIAGLSAHPKAGKLALGSWHSTDNDRLRQLAEALRGEKACKKLATAALEFVDTNPSPKDPPFNAYLALSRIGASVPPTDDPEQPWPLRVSWPQASFEFSPPKHAKSVLTFARDPNRDCELDFYGTRDVHHLGHDSHGWQYFVDRVHGGYWRDLDGKTQFVKHFFDWLGKEVQSAPQSDPLVGSWIAKTVEYPQGHPEPAAPNEAELTIQDDGVCRFTRFGNPSEGSYTSEGRALSLSLPLNETVQMRANASFSEIAWVDHDEEEGKDVTITFVRT